PGSGTPVHSAGSRADEHDAGRATLGTLALGLAVTSALGFAAMHQPFEAHAHATLGVLSGLGHGVAGVVEALGRWPLLTLAGALIFAAGVVALPRLFRRQRGPPTPPRPALGWFAHAAGRNFSARSRSLTPLEPTASSLSLTAGIGLGALDVLGLTGGFVLLTGTAPVLAALLAAGWLIFRAHSTRPFANTTPQGGKSWLDHVLPHRSSSSPGTNLNGSARFPAAPNRSPTYPDASPATADLTTAQPPTQQPADTARGDDAATTNSAKPRPRFGRSRPATVIISRSGRVPALTIGIRAPWRWVHLVPALGWLIGLAGIGLWAWFGVDAHLVVHWLGHAQGTVMAAGMFWLPGLGELFREPGTTTSPKVGHSTIVGDGLDDRQRARLAHIARRAEVKETLGPGKLARLSGLTRRRFAKAGVTLTALVEFDDRIRAIAGPGGVGIVARPDGSMFTDIRTLRVLRRLSRTDPAAVRALLENRLVGIEHPEWTEQRVLAEAPMPDLPTELAEAIGADQRTGRYEFAWTGDEHPLLLAPELGDTAPAEADSVFQVGGGTGVLVKIVERGGQRFGQLLTNWHVVEMAGVRVHAASMTVLAAGATLAGGFAVLGWSTPLHVAAGLVWAATVTLVPRPLASNIRVRGPPAWIVTATVAGLLGAFHATPTTTLAVVLGAAVGVVAIRGLLRTTTTVWSRVLKVGRTAGTLVVTTALSLGLILLLTAPAAAASTTPVAPGTTSASAVVTVTVAVLGGVAALTTGWLSGRWERWRRRAGAIAVAGLLMTGISWGAERHFAPPDDSNFLTGSAMVRAGSSYRIGDPTRPRIGLDEDFRHDPDAKASFGDDLSWIRWGAQLRAARFLRPDLDDATAMYAHYRDGTGTPVTVDYEEAYHEDDGVRSGINDEILTAKVGAERIHHNTGKTAFSITGNAGRSYSTTEDWQKTLGAHRIWGSGEVRIEGNRARMTITIHAVDRYNFNKGDKDAATHVPDNVNGRFAQLGWARSFDVTGSLTRTVTWTLGHHKPTGRTTEVAGDHSAYDPGGEDRVDGWAGDGVGRLGARWLLAVAAMAVGTIARVGAGRLRISLLPVGILVVGGVLATPGVADMILPGVGHLDPAHLLISVGVGILTYRLGRAVKLERTSAETEQAETAQQSRRSEAATEEEQATGQRSNTDERDAGLATPATAALATLGLAATLAVGLMAMHQPLFAVVLGAAVGVFAIRGLLRTTTTVWSQVLKVGRTAGTLVVTTALSLGLILLLTAPAAAASTTPV
ncbi:MAG: hypothetical protein J2P19_20000, partial [Pseudonocardia sp.]|nr:hypothetical protein [Pseudonocardia sp.]